MIKVFIDGNKGTTGLKLKERLSKREDIEILEIEEKDRKDINVKKQFMEESDFTFLCLPDDASREAVKTAGKNVRIIDASTAHRTEKNWAYGLPELSSEHRKKIVSSSKTAVPGCHASGFAVIVYPLIKAGIISEDYPLVCHSLTGYSGGGKSMIEEYNNTERDREYMFPRQYGLSQQHKHLKEMKAVCGLSFDPIFCPVVADFYSGMEVSLPFYRHLLKKGGAKDIYNVLKEHYSGQGMIKVNSYNEGDKKGFLSAGLLEKRDDMQIFVFGNEDRILVSAVYDNLGKGASGAAVQCMNIMAGLKEDYGLVKGD